MKSKLKKSLKIGILLFGISVILTNCQKDDQSVLDESQLEQTTPLVLNQKIPFTQTQHYNKLEEKINKVKEKASNYNSQNRTENDDIEILTNEVLYITYASTHTYSFKVLREQPQAFIENIVLHYNIETEDYDEYLVQYHVAAEEFVNLHNGNLLQNSENVTIIDLENGFFDNNTQAKGCNIVCNTIFVDCSSGAHHSGNVGDWGSCTASESPSAYQSCSSFCDQDNAITPSDGPSGGGGGGNTTVVFNPLPTEPCDTNSTGGIGITGSNGDCISWAGMEDGLPYNWWNDEDFIINSGHFDIDDERPNAQEVALFALYPSQALLHIENSITALEKAEELVVNGTLTGIGDGKADAFRHAFWNALGTAEFGSVIMRLFADAHEWGESGLSVTMDFYNNHKGRVIGENYAFLTSEATISAAILQAVFDGTLKYINNSGVLVPTNL